MSGGRRELAAGVVDEDVDPPEALHRPLDEVLHVLWLADVGPNREAVAAELALDLLERPRPPSADGDLRARADELASNGASDAGSAARYERDLAVVGVRRERGAEGGYGWTILNGADTAAER